jgi:succinyl-CoA synthetase alpha subunit
VSILVGPDTRLVVTGLTGREGSFHAANNRRYGTNVVAGVTPGKGGQDVDGVPVFDTVHAAVEATGANTASRPRTPASSSSWPSPRASRRTTCCASTPTCAAARPG